MVWPHRLHFVLLLASLVPTCHRRSEPVTAACLALPPWWRTAAREAAYRGPPRDTFATDTLFIEGSRLRWDGDIVSPRALDARLETARFEDPPALVVLEISQARDCALARAVRVRMDRHFCQQGNCALGDPTGW